MLNSKKMFTNRKSLILALLYMLLIFILSSIPDYTSPEKANVARKIVQNILHIPMFGLLAFLWLRSFNIKNIGINRSILYSLIITIAYAAFDEFHQSFAPGRFCTFSDFLLDAFGCVAALMIVKRHISPQSTDRTKG